MDIVSLLLIYLMSGAVAGMIAGLLGVGGGIVVVPVLVFVFEAQGLSEAILVHLAVGSSLAIIVLTSLSSIHSHHQLGAVRWRIWLLMLPGIVIGAVFGVYTVLQLDGALLKRLIGILAVLVAIKMLYKSKRVQLRPLPRLGVLASSGTIIGWVSAMLGIGGGTMSVPFLSRYRLSMPEVIGTSSAIGLPIAIAGAGANVAMGWAHEGLPDLAAGFIYWPAVAGVAVASVIFARLGARFAHRASDRLLKRAFAVMLMIVGIKFLFF